MYEYEIEHLIVVVFSAARVGSWSELSVRVYVTHVSRVPL
jgi:hypothetical protein